MFGYDKIPNVYAIGSLILMIAVPNEGLLVGPMNTAVMFGSRTTLNCSSEFNSPFWLWRMPNSTIIVSSESPCVVNPSFAGIYAVSAPTVGSSYCNLIILSATSAEAGSYSCSDGGSVGTAMLLVLDSGPHCSTDPVNDTVVYPTYVTMNCSVQYNPSSGWTPNLRWNTTRSTSSGTAGTTAYSTFTYNTDASTPIPSYSCAVVYNSSVFVDIQPCSTHEVEVLSRPSRVTILGAEDGSIAYGSSLTCLASGNPIPTYKWFNSANNLLANVSSLIARETGNYNCTASNTVNGQLFSDSASLFVKVTGNPGPVYTSPTTETKNVTAIVLGVLLGGVVPVIILIIIIIVLLKKRKANTTAGDQSIYEAPQKRNIEQETPYTSLDLTGKGGGSSNHAIYQNSPTT